jgi:hypothetical protein
MSIGLLSARLRGLLQREDLQGLVLPLAGASGLSLYALVSEGGISFPLFTVVFYVSPLIYNTLPLIRVAKVMVEVTILSTRVPVSLESRENLGREFRLLFSHASLGAFPVRRD